MTSPALENSLSLATHVAGIASRRWATLATSGYDVMLAAHQRSGHWSRAIAGTVTYRSYSCWVRDAVVWYAMVIFIIVTSSRTRPPVAVAGWTTKWAEVQRRRKEHQRPKLPSCQASANFLLVFVAYSILLRHTPVPVIQGRPHTTKCIIVWQTTTIVSLILLILARQPYWIVGSHVYESLKYWNNKRHASHTNHCTHASLKSFIDGKIAHNSKSRFFFKKSNRVQKFQNRPSLRFTFIHLHHSKWIFTIVYCRMECTAFPIFPIFLKYQIM